MRISRGRKPSPYEVRCPRCDVSFPVETRTCFHCGGPTALPGIRTAPRSIPVFERPQTPDGRAGDAIEPESESPFSFGDAFGDDPYGDTTADRELPQQDQPPTVVRSILGNLGGLVWVILLIAFSIARSCGE